MNTVLKVSCVVALMAAIAVPESAKGAVFYLRAGETNLAMPDGQVIRVWGFARDTSLAVNDGTITVPGPALEIPVGDPNLTIHLKNHLPNLNGAPVPVSIIIPGLTAALSPVRHVNGRVRSFTHESFPGAPGTYSWNDVKPGTYLYHSGTHPALQVQMGLYGGLKKNFGTGEAYAGKTFDREVVLFYSELDPALHSAVALDDYGPGKSVTSTVHYAPKYFLINGSPFSGAASPLPAGSVGEKVLVRFYNAGLKSHAPLLQGAFMKVIAEDGRAYRYPKERYSFLLPAGKTMDALVEFRSAGQYAIYDRMMALTTGAGLPGGFLAFLAVSAAP